MVGGDTDLRQADVRGGGGWGGGEVGGGGEGSRAPGRQGAWIILELWLLPRKPCGSAQPGQFGEWAGGARGEEEERARNSAEVGKAPEAVSSSVTFLLIVQRLEMSVCLNHLGTVAGTRPVLGVLCHSVVVNITLEDLDK